MKKSLLRFVLFFPMVLLLCFTFSCQQQGEKAEIEEAEAVAELEAQNKELARHFLDEAWGKGNAEIIDEVLSAEFILHASNVGVEPNRAGYKQWVSNTSATFSNIETTVEDMIVEKDKVVTRWTWVGTHEGEFMGIAPTDKQITVTGISIDLIKEGKIVEEWIEMDQLSMMQQLGVVQPPGGQKES